MLLQNKTKHKEMGDMINKKSLDVKIFFLNWEETWESFFFFLQDNGKYCG